MKEKVAKDINILASFCGKRDLPELTQKALEDKSFGYVSVKLKN